MSDRRQDSPLPPLPPRFRLTPEFRLLLASHMDRACDAGASPGGADHGRVFPKASTG